MAFWHPRLDAPASATVAEGERFRKRNRGRQHLTPPGPVLKLHQLFRAHCTRSTASAPSVNHTARSA
jgi:hypothetical protein